MDPMTKRSEEREEAIEALEDLYLADTVRLSTWEQWCEELAEKLGAKFERPPVGVAYDADEFYGRVRTAVDREVDELVRSCC